MARDEGTVTLEGVRLIFRNFAGKEGRYNSEGDRNFGVVIPSREIAEQMAADGWNIKYLHAREEEGEEEDTPWLHVSVGGKEGTRPPTIAMITASRGRTNLTVPQSELLDYSDIAIDENGLPKVDLIIRPYNWEVNGAQGIKAYLKSIFVTVEEDRLEAKYASVEIQ